MIPQNIQDDLTKLQSDVDTQDLAFSQANDAQNALASASAANDQAQAALSTAIENVSADTDQLIADVKAWETPQAPPAPTPGSPAVKK